MPSDYTSNEALLFSPLLVLEAWPCNALLRLKMRLSCAQVAHKLDFNANNPEERTKEVSPFLIPR